MARTPTRKKDPTAALRRIAGKYCRLLRTDPRVAAVCLVGSLARGDADACSDVDLCVLAADRHLDSIRGQHTGLAARAHPVLVSGGLIGSTTCCALHEISGSIIKVDVDYLSLERLPAKLRSASMREYFSHCDILFERRKALSRLLRNACQSPRPRPAVPPSPSFAIAAWSVLRMARRGELFEAVDIMNHMRDPILTRLLCRAHRLPFQNFRRLESRLPAGVVRRLRLTIPRPAKREILRALRELLGLYRRALEATGITLDAEESAALRRISRELS